MMNSRMILTEQLMKIAPRKRVSQDSALLQAYTLFSLIPTDAEDLKDEISKIYEHNLDRISALFRFDLSSCLYEDLVAARDLFLSFSLMEFLRFIVPDIVCNIKELIRLHQVSNQNILNTSFHIIQLKKIYYQVSGTLTVQNALSDLSEKKLYDLYQKEISSHLQLNHNDFSEWFQAVNLFPLDQKELFPCIRVGYSHREINEALSILTDELGLSTARQIEVCNRFFRENTQADSLSAEETIYRFLRIKSRDKRRNRLSKAIALIARMQPLDLACSIPLFKKATETSDGNTEKYIRTNDIMLENGLIYSKFSACISEHCEEKVVVLFPTPQFINKWLDDRFTKKTDTTFVCEDANMSSFLQYHFFDYCQFPGGRDSCKFRITDIETWMGEVRDGAAFFQIGLAFFTRIQADLQKVIMNTLQETREKTSSRFYFLLSGSRTVLQDFVCYDDANIKISGIDVLPQGIRNSSRPHRKALVEVNFNGEHCDPLQKIVRLTAYQLDYTFQKQAIRKVPKEETIHADSLSDLNTSLLRLYYLEVEGKAESAKSRVASELYPFTPDLMIRYSKSYPEHNQGRPRIEAYFCESTEEDQDGRGKMLYETQKHVTRHPDSYVQTWLESDYPFSFVQERRSKNSDSGLRTPALVSVRDTAIEYYSVSLEGKNIAIKTFWYLFPSLEDNLSEDDYQVLRNLMNTDLGQIRVWDLDADTCEEKLIELYPELSAQQLQRRFRILATVMDCACENGFCTQNPLQTVLADIRKSDRLFAQVRTALTKKHLTESEYNLVYDTALDQLKRGELEYLGVLIRLISGLSANIICALQWKDVVSIPVYGIQKLMISKQVTNDGTTVRGFDSADSYICFPCSDQMSLLLQDAVNTIKSQLPSDSLEDLPGLPIVTTKEKIRKKRDRKHWLAPKKLDQICRIMIAEIGIDEHVIEVPDRDSGTKESNLSKYGGDFLRENFRFRASTIAKLSPDEVAYLLGNKPVSTVGRHYIDFLNDTSQLIMHEKLNRMDRRTENAETQPIHRTVSGRAGETCTIILDSTGEPVTAMLSIELPLNAKKLMLETESTYGLNRYYAPVEER